MTTGSVFVRIYSKIVFCTFCFFSISFLKGFFLQKQERLLDVLSERFNKDQHDSIFHSLEETLKSDLAARDKDLVRAIYICLPVDMSVCLSHMSTTVCLKTAAYTCMRRRRRCGEGGDVAHRTSSRVIFKSDLC